jgi:predicted DNA-binding antitoxin AbrB/MazE fold protein
MEQAVEAVFENGSFTVIDPSSLHLSEGQRVKLIVEEAPSSKNNPVDLLTKMYEGLSEKEPTGFDLHHHMIRGFARVESKRRDQTNYCA